MTKRSVIGALLLLAAIPCITATVNCGGDGDSPVEPEDSYIGAEGGTVTDSGGASVYIPPGALSETTDIKVKTLHDDGDLPDSLVSSLLECGGGGVFEPHGLVFSSPVTITLPLNTPAAPGDTLHIFTWSDDYDAWEETQFRGVVATDGMSVSAEVTHFSRYMVDLQLANGGSLFDFFEYGLPASVAFENFYNNFLSSVMAPYEKRLPPKSGCCFEISKIYFYMEYVKDGVMTPLEHSTGDQILCDRTERIVSTQGDPGSGNYCTLLVSVCMNYSDPGILIQYEGYKHYLNIDEGENETMIEGKFNCSDRWSDEGGMLEFTVDGPGFVSPSRIASSDNWAVKFTSFEPGTANITVTFVSCGENPSQSPSQTISIECRETLGWFVDIQFEFLHEGEGVDWVFEDEVRIVADLRIVDEADSAVTGENIAGTHPETTVAADHCDLTAILAPDFEGGYLKGTKTGNEIQFRYAPDPATYFVLFGLHCERDPDPPFDIMVTTYANMEASIISQVLFTLPLVNGAWVEDYGEEDFGSSPAVQYWYSAQIGKQMSTD